MGSRDKKKIMILITGLGVGGAENMLYKLIPKFEKIDVCLVSILGIKDIGDKLEKKGFHVNYLNSDSKFNFIKTVSNFRKLVKREKPDVLVTFLIHADLFGRFFGRLFGIKKVYCSIRNDYSKLTFLNSFDKYSKFLVDLYLPNSDSLVDVLHEKNKVALNKISVIPNAVDVEVLEKSVNKDYDLRKEYRLDKDCVVFSCVARLKEQKNHKTLIRGFALLKDRVDVPVCLFLIGDGDCRKKLESLVKELGVDDSVFFLGTRNDVLTLLHNSDVFVLPSLIEGMSNALLEAMALRKCCVVSDIKQNTVLIENGVSGLVFDVLNSEELCGCMVKVCCDFRLREKLGKCGYDDILEKYSLDKIVGEFEELLG